jgi:UDP-glucose 4-epimerase
MGNNILILGGAGFIGSYLANILSDKNDVIVLDNLINGDANRLNDKIKFIQSDVYTTKIDFTEFDYIYYLACSQISESDERPFYDCETNALGLLRVLEAVKDSKRLKKLIYTSSCSVYGNNYDATEESNIDINSIYAATKYLGENYCKVYAKNYGVPMNIVRYSNVYGYNQTPDYTCGVIGKFINYASRGKRLTVIDAEATRDYTFIEDAVEATILVGYNAPLNEIYNISTNVASSIRDIIQILKNHFKVTTRDLSSRSIDNIKYRKIINDKLLKLGWRARYDLKQGIDKIIEHEYSSSN